MFLLLQFIDLLLLLHPAARLPLRLSRGRGGGGGGGGTDGGTEQAGKGENIFFAWEI